tara:strand:- start:570 stop:1601 length:1032 start_codon:yes stop_codon:yes gene_type:complete
VNFFKKFSKNLNSNEEKNKANFDIENIEKNPEPEIHEKLKCKLIKDFYLLSDDEIIEKLHELTEPIYPILSKIKIKEKDWMPDEEKNDYGVLKNYVLADSLFDDEDLDEYISGMRTHDPELDYEEEEEELEISDYLSSFTRKIGSIQYESESIQEYVFENKKLLKNIELEFLKIFWSSFDIDEDLLDVVEFWEKYPQYSSDGEPTKEQKDQYQRYQKAYFYAKDKVIRAAKIFKRFEKQKRAKLNSKSIPKKKIEENLTEVGFVYFIRNKDIYKIGITQNMLQRMEQLKPDELLDSIRCINYKELEREIHSKFKGCRIPQTEYFRLDKKEIKEIHQMLRENAK